MAREVSDEDKIRQVFKIFGIAVLILAAAIVLLGSFYTIESGQRGVLTTWGRVSEVPITDGLHMKWPIAQKVIKMDVKTQKYEAELTAASKDLQDVRTKIAINYRVNANSVPEVYRTIGIDYATNIIYPAEQEVNKAATASFTAEEAITKRDELRTKMLAVLKEKLEPRGIIVEDVSIVDFQFSPSFTQAIERKVVAEQSALEQRNLLEQVKYQSEQTVVVAEADKRSKIARAEGEAESIRIQSQALQQNKDILQLRWIEKWNGMLPQTMLSDAIPLINIEQMRTN